MREMFLAFVLAFALAAAILYISGAYDEAWAEFVKLLREIVR